MAVSEEGSVVPTARACASCMPDVEANTVPLRHVRCHDFAMESVPVASPLDHARLRRAAWLIGIALGGFFDGILLHQVLQWHHLLSGLDGTGWQDIRVQITADGLFHAAMLLLAVCGVASLLRGHRALQAEHAPRRLAGRLLMGFGAWHTVDVALNHWVLGLHRVRMDVPEPLWWDLAWFAVFGLAMVALGGALTRGATPPGSSSAGPGGGTGRGTRRSSDGRAAAAKVPGQASDRPVAADRDKLVAPRVPGIRPRPPARRIWLAPLVAVATVLAGAAALRPVGGSQLVTVWLAPGTPAWRAHEVADDIGARIVDANPSGDVWVMTMGAMGDGRGPSWRLRADALVIPGGAYPLACTATRVIQAVKR